MRRIKDKTEPDSVDFEHAGLKCALRRGPFGHWCGYVGILSSHPWFGKRYDDCLLPEARPTGETDFTRSLPGGLMRERAEARLRCADDFCLHIPEHFIDVHGGITYSEPSPGGSKEPDGLWWFGFDCAHLGDRTNITPEGVYRDVNYATAETMRMAEQLAGVGDA